MARILHLPLGPKRSRDSFKNNFGRVLVVGGSVGMSGAAVMSGVAALRSGAGLVEIATPESVWPIVAAANPCCMTTPFPEKNGIISKDAIPVLRERVGLADVVVLGPGLGVSNDAREVVRWLISQQGLRLLIDADGLNNLSKISGWEKNAKAQIVLTPHPGEMRRLWNGSVRESMPAEREEAAMQYSKMTGGVVVLKGSGTVVASGDDYYINDTGNPGMATAGSGDVLSGMIAALWAQFALGEESDVQGQGENSLSSAGICKPAFEAGVLGVHLHGMAGDLAAKEHGEHSMIATDLIDFIGQSMQSLF